MAEKKGLPKEGAKALLDAWGDDNAVMLKQAKKEEKQSERGEDREVRRVFKGK